LRTRLATLFYTNPRGVILFLTLNGIAWGIPVYMDSIFSTAPLYRFIGTILNEQVAGSVVIVVNVVQFLALLFWRVGILRCTMLFTISLWAFLTAGFIASGAVGTGPWLNLMHTIAAVWAYLGLGVRMRNGYQ
jgi:hypothetical protein